MVSNLARQAWEYYRRYGLVDLVSAASAEKHRIIPFRYRTAIRNRINEFKYDSDVVPQPLKVYQVSPDRIQYNGPIFSHDRHVGTVRAGDWDTNASTLTDEEMYIGLYERFVDGFDWEDTRYYELAERQFESDDEWLGYTSLDSFEENRLPYLERLYHDIEENGYRPQTELNGDKIDDTRHGSVPDYHRKINEITCNIARDGRLLLNNGIHRISIAKMLDIDEIPIQIIVRHEEWQQARADIAESDSPVDTAMKYGIEPTHPTSTYLFSRGKDSN